MENTSPLLTNSTTAEIIKKNSVFVVDTELKFTTKILKAVKKNKFLVIVNYPDIYHLLENGVMHLSLSSTYTELDGENKYMINTIRFESNNFVIKNMKNLYNITTREKNIDTLEIINCPRLRTVTIRHAKVLRIPGPKKSSFRLYFKHVDQLDIPDTACWKVDLSHYKNGMLKYYDNLYELCVTGITQELLDKCNPDVFNVNILRISDMGDLPLDFTRFQLDKVTTLCAPYSSNIKFPIYGMNKVISWTSRPVKNELPEMPALRFLFLVEKEISWTLEYKTKKEKSVVEEVKSTAILYKNVISNKSLRMEVRKHDDNQLKTYRTEEVFDVDEINSLCEQEIANRPKSAANV